MPLLALFARILVWYVLYRGKRLAKKYYDKLFKEYCIADLTRYKENKVHIYCVYFVKLWILAYMSVVWLIYAVPFMVCSFVGISHKNQWRIRRVVMSDLYFIVIVLIQYVAATPNNDFDFWFLFVWRTSELKHLSICLNICACITHRLNFSVQFVAFTCLHHVMLLSHSLLLWLSAFPCHVYYHHHHHHIYLPWNECNNK